MMIWFLNRDYKYLNLKIKGDTTLIEFKMKTEKNSLDFKRVVI